MTTNFTKRELIKALEEERDKQLSLRNYSNNEKIRKLKEECLNSKFGQQIKDLVLASQKALDMQDRLLRAINNDTDISTYGTSNRGLIYQSNNKKNLMDHLINSFIYFREGLEVNCYIRELNNEVSQIELEWNKLINIVRSLSKKEAVAFLEENKIEIPTLEEQKKETTALVNYQINTSLLFTEKETKDNE